MFDAEPTREPLSPETLHTKIEELTLENDFLEGALASGVLAQSDDLSLHIYRTRRL